jgi:hypothetical protein
MKHLLASIIVGAGVALLASCGSEPPPPPPQVKPKPKTVVRYDNPESFRAVGPEN